MSKQPLKRCKILDANGKKYEAIHVNDGSTGNTINHLLSEHDITKKGKTNVSIFLILLCKYLKLKN